MNISVSIYDKLKSYGFKLTRGRKLIINFFIDRNQPVSAMEIMDFLHKRKINLHKTTIYRQLEFLLELNMIRKLQFADRKKCMKYVRLTTTTILFVKIVRRQIKLHLRH